jgi:alkylation response protein AidB-like acyl-CoA dehydrogenase
VNFDLTEDQVALRDGIRSLLDGKFPMSRVREGFDRGMFDELTEAGVFSLRTDGFGWADAAVVYEELGRALVPGPLVWSFGAEVITGGVEARSEPGAVVEHLSALDALLVVSDRGIDRLDPATLGGEPVDWPLDPLTPVTRLDRLPEGERVGDVADAVALRGRGALLTAAYCVGMADALTGLAVEYAKERRQFDRPIGSFQAVKHLCADMAVRLEVARAATYAAACVLDDPSAGDAGRALSAAKLLAGEAAIANGRSATQVYGGMGFTWEVDVHLYLKRAWVLATSFGTIDAHADAVAERLPPR